MIGLDRNDCIVVEAEVHDNGFVVRLLRGIRQTFLEGAATYGAGFHGCPGLYYPPADTGEQSVSKF
jgi:hypothetical protein